MYENIYKNVIFPFYEKIRGRNTYKYTDMFESMQWEPTERILEYQKQKLNEIVNYAYNNVEYYKYLFDSISFNPINFTYDEFRKIPFLTKDIIRENFDKIQNLKLDSKISYKTTGGSTGQPLSLSYDHNCYEEQRAVYNRGYGWSGYADGKRTAFLWSVNLGEKHFVHDMKEWLHKKILNQKYYNCFDLTIKTSEQYLSSMRRYSPDYIISYGLQMYYFAKMIKMLNLPVFNLKGIILGAEKVSDDQILFIEKIFGCPVYNTYGCREFMLIASDCGKKEGMHLNVDRLFIEVLDENNNPVSPGEVGKIVITDLSNRALPFIRYRNDDIVKTSNRMCSCGRGLPLIEGIEGRMLDVIRTPSGQMVSGVFFPHLMKDFEFVDRFQVIQKEIDLLHIKIVPMYGKMPEDKGQQIINRVKSHLGISVNVNIDFVDRIPLTPSGKQRVTISELKDSVF